MAPAPEEPRALRQGLLAALLGTGLFFLLLEVLLRLGGCSTWAATAVELPQPKAESARFG